MFSNYLKDKTMKGREVKVWVLAIAINGYVKRYILARIAIVMWGCVQEWLALDEGF